MPTSPGGVSLCPSPDGAYIFWMSNLQAAVSHRMAQEVQHHIEFESLSLRNSSKKGHISPTWENGSHSLPSELAMSRLVSRAHAAKSNGSTVMTVSDSFCR